MPEGAKSCEVRLALVQSESAHRLVQLGGTEPQLMPIPRSHTAVGLCLAGPPEPRQALAGSGTDANTSSASSLCG